MSSFFRAYDIRGEYPEEVNEEVFERVGKALGTYLKGGEVVVGRDARGCSPRLYHALIKGLVSTGCEVTGLGGVPNAICFFYGHQRRRPGAYVTASHNPVGWGGAKFFDSRGASFVEQNEEVKKIYDSKNFIKGKGSFEHVWNPVRDYESFWKEKLPKLEGKVVVECFGGAGAYVTPELFNNLGLEVVALNATPDPEFCGYHRPEPKGDNLQSLKERVVEEGALFGAAFDGDADRTVFVDDKGRELHGGIMGSLFIKHLVGEGDSAVVTLDVTSNMDRVTESVNGTLHRSRVGHGYITKALLDTGSVFACEWSSHYWFEHYPASEGPASILLAADMIQKRGRKLSSMVDELEEDFTMKHYVHAGSHENKKRIVNEFREKYPNAEDAFDGIKKHLNDREWFMVRESQTNPEVGLVVEGRSEERMNEILQKLVKEVEELK